MSELSLETNILIWVQVKRAGLMMKWNEMKLNNEDGEDLPEMCDWERVCVQQSSADLMPYPVSCSQKKDLLLALNQSEG